MSCQHCVASLKNVLDKLTGIHSSDVEIGSATVTYDENLMNAILIISAIKDAGYQVVS